MFTHMCARKALQDDQNGHQKVPDCLFLDLLPGDVQVVRRVRCLSCYQNIIPETAVLKQQATELNSAMVWIPFFKCKVTDPVRARCYPKFQVKLEILNVEAKVPMAFNILINKLFSCLTLKVLNF